MLLFFFMQFIVMWVSENGLKDCKRIHANEVTWRLLRSTNVYTKVRSNWITLLINSLKQHLICNMSTWGIYRTTWRKITKNNFCSICTCQLLPCASDLVANMSFIVYLFNVHCVSKDVVLKHCESVNCLFIITSSKYACPFSSQN